MLRLPDIISYRAACTAVAVQQRSGRQIKKFRILCTVHSRYTYIIENCNILGNLDRTGSVRWAKLCRRRLNGLSIAKIRPQYTTHDKNRVIIVHKPVDSCLIYFTSCIIGNKLLFVSTITGIGHSKTMPRACTTINNNIIISRNPL